MPKSMPKSIAQLAVWKFLIPWPPTADYVSIEMPSGSTVLCVQTLGKQPCIWAVCDTDPEAPKTTKRFRIAGTGHPLEGDESGRYIGTFQLMDGRLVFHVFELP